MAGHRDQQFQNAGAQEPAGRALDQRIGIIRFGRTEKNECPNQPENKNGQKDGPAGIAGTSVCLAGEKPAQVVIIEGIVLENQAENGKHSRETKICQKKRGHDDRNFQLAPGRQALFSDING